MIKAAAPDKVKAIKSRLLVCCDAADHESGASEPVWRDAIDNIDTEPERVLNCNPILHHLIEQALK